MSQTTHTQDQGFSTKGAYVTGGEEFTRDTHYIEDRITRNGAPGNNGEPGWPVEPGRYRLIAARACPWANRTVIVRRLLGLEDVLSIGQPGPTHDARSWTFDLDPDGIDPVLGIQRIQDAYFRRFPDYPRGITVPAIVDVPSGQVVTNDFPQITLDFSSEWTQYHRDRRAGPLPGAPAGRNRRGQRARLHRGEQRRLPVRLCRLPGGVRCRLRSAVARSGLARGPPGRAAVPGGRHDHRGRRPPVHHPGPLRRRVPRPLQVQPAKLSEMPVLWAYARDLFQTPGFGDTIDFVQIKQHYYIVHEDINPTGIVPRGPETGGWLSPHGREALGGRPFGDGTPPGPVRAGEEVAQGHGAV